MRTHRFGELLGRDPAFCDLIDNGPVVSVLEDIIGTDFRLDHTYADIIRRGDGPIGTVLHGGAIPFNSSEYYFILNNEIHGGLVAVAFNLRVWARVAAVSTAFPEATRAHTPSRTNGSSWRSRIPPCAG